MRAILKSKVNLDSFANCVNNARTDGISFYVNNGKISVSCWHRDMSKEEQKEELEWFLRGEECEFEQC